MNAEWIIKGGRCEPIRAGRAWRHVRWMQNPVTGEWAQGAGESPHAAIMAALRSVAPRRHRLPSRPAVLALAVVLAVLGALV